MAQSGPGFDISQRLFAELRSRNEETRVKASYELRDTVVTCYRGKIGPLLDSELN